MSSHLITALIPKDKHKKATSLSGAALDNGIGSILDSGRIKTTATL